MGCPCGSGPPSSSCLGGARFDLLAFLFQAHVGRSTQQRRGGRYCSRSASTHQGSASSGSFTPKRDREMVCLVSTLWGGSLPGVCWDQAVWQEKQWHSSPILSLSPPVSRREHLPVTFVCQPSSPPSVLAFLRVTLFSALSSGTSLQLLSCAPHPHS